jgi:hypothetical protein
MKKTLFLTSVLAAFSVATFFTTGCSEKKTNGPTCNTVAGTDTGAHVIYIGGNTNDLLPKVQDSIIAVSVTKDSVTITSKALGNKMLTGKLDPNDCNKILLDSLYVGSGPSDTIKIPTTLPLPGGYVKIWNVRAGGTGTLTANGATTVLNIAKGKTNIVVGPLDFTTIPMSLGQLSLRGTFLRIK